MPNVCYFAPFILKFAIGSCQEEYLRKYLTVLRFMNYYTVHLFFYVWHALRNCFYNQWRSFLYLKIYISFIPKEILVTSIMWYGSTSEESQFGILQLLKSKDFTRYFNIISMLIRVWYWYKIHAKGISNILNEILSNSKIYFY